VPPAIAADTMLQYMAVDKKNQDGNIRLVLLHALGRAYVDAGIPRSTLRDFLLRHMPQS
jgi:3-dehydroquinate synthetase